MKVGIPLLLTLALLPTPGLAAQQPAAKSEPPDSALIALGKQLYEGRGLCTGCHGAKGEGMLGPTTELGAGKEKWLHHDGSIDAIAAVITKGIDADHSVSGQVMPPKGGSRLTAAQIRAVAAYVRQMHSTAAPKENK